MSKQEREKQEKDEGVKRKQATAKQLPTGEQRARKDVAAAFLNNVPGEREVPASELGAPKEGLPESEVHLSSFELMTVSGADAEQINIYLEGEAKHRFHKPLRDISDEQYDKLLSDKVKFHKWMAKNWVDDYISKRKNDVRAIAETKTGKYGSGEDILRLSRFGSIPEDWQETLQQADAAGVKQGREEIIRARDELSKQIEVKREQLRTLATSLETQHKTMLDQQREQLETQGFDKTVTERILAGFEATYTKARTDLVAEQEDALRTFKESGEAELETRIAELRTDIETTVHKLRSGTKREMVLTADRWGRVLKKLADINPEAVSVDQTGIVSFDYFATTREGQRIIEEHINKELDRIIDAKAQGSESGIRQYNLEALFKSKEEITLALIYIRLLSSRIQSGSKKNPKNVYRHQLLYTHLRKQGFIEPIEALKVEAELRPAYQEQRLAIPSALKEVKKMIETESDPDVTIVVYQLINIVKNGGISWTQGVRRGYLSDYGVMFAEVLEAIEEKNKTKNYVEETPWFELEQVIKKDTSAGYLERRVLPVLYRIQTQRDRVLSAVRGLYLLPDTLQKDFIGSEWSGSTQLTLAAADQMKIHFKRWSRDGSKGREAAQRAIWCMTQEVQKAIKGKIDTINHTAYVGTDPRELAKKLRFELEQAEYRLKQYSPHLEMLAQMANEP